MSDPILLSILSGLILTLAGMMYRGQHNRLNIIEKKTTKLNDDVNAKASRENCEDHRNHQMKLNLEMIDRLARIETKMDLLLTGKK